MSFVGKKFPNIEVNAMSDLGDTFKINVLNEAVNNKKKVLLFWYPKDFTFVCPTGIEGVTYPILADSNRNLARTLGILDSNEVYDEVADAYLLEGDDVTFRATYLIDETGKVFHESINDMPLGRNVKEYLRLVDAYTHVQQHGEVCPANWEEGKDAMNADRKGVASYLASH